MQKIKSYNLLLPSYLQLFSFFSEFGGGTSPSPVDPNLIVLPGLLCPSHFLHKDLDQTLEDLRRQNLTTYLSFVSHFTGADVEQHFGGRKLQKIESCDLFPPSHLKFLNFFRIRKGGLKKLIRTTFFGSYIWHFSPFFSELWWEFPFFPYHLRGSTTDCTSRPSLSFTSSIQ